MYPLLVLCTMVGAITGRASGRLLCLKTSKHAPENSNELLTDFCNKKLLPKYCRVNCFSKLGNRKMTRCQVWPHIMSAPDWNSIRRNTQYKQKTSNIK